jgi:hypothetical protein
MMGVMGVRRERLHRRKRRRGKNEEGAREKE